MNDDTVPLPGCVYLGFFSLIASLLGSILAAAIYAAISPQVHLGTGMEGFARFLLNSGVVFFFGIFIALPVGLTVGIPLMAVSRKILLGHVVVAAPVFAVLGLFGGLAIKDATGGSPLVDAEVVFGTCVGGMHPLVYARANGIARFKLLTALLLSVATVCSLVYVGNTANLM